MSLRSRILAIALGTLVLALLVGYLAASRFLLTGYQDLEATLVRGRMEAVEGVVLESLRSLGKTVHLMSLVQLNSQPAWDSEQLYRLDIDALVLIAANGTVTGGAAASGDLSFWDFLSC